MTLLVSALGYFIDIFDLTMFSIVRIPSLESLGVPPGEALAVGARILNLQQAGLLIGGILWGLWGDRKGRVTVLFGSIFLYSSATLASAFVTSIPAYGIARFLAGLGLAAELGAAVTLVGESMSRKSRGWGTALIASTGLLGAVAAALTAGNFSWRTAYLAGGALGLLLLFGRMSVRESGIFRSLASRAGVRRGDLPLLFASPERVLRYALCVLAGLPICASIGVLVYFSPEISRSAGTMGTVSAGTAVMCAYLGMSLGDLACSGVSQALRSRKMAAAIFTGALAVIMAVFTSLHGISTVHIYLLCGALGLASGYWIVLITSSAEQFGTNLRATVATSIPNLVRGLNGPLAIIFASLSSSMGPLRAGLMIAIACSILGLAAIALMRETFGKDLRFIEK